MTLYPLSKYKNPFSNGVPQPSRVDQGWGPGWPHCQANKMVTVTAQDQTAGQNYDIKVTVRKEIGPMVANLLEATDRLYDINQHDTGAYNCRPISGTNTPSNHSWGLAVDINWDDNPYSSTFKSTIPPAVVAMWVACGWGWGGFYRGGHYDTMHFEYLGSPADVAKDAALAAKYNQAPVPAPIPKPKVLDQKTVLQLALGAGFSRAEANVMSVIAYYESGWDPKNIGDASLSKYGSRGLWQIFTKVHSPDEVLGHGGSSWTPSLITELEDPAKNAHAAHVVFKEQGFDAWSTYKDRSQHSGWNGLLAKAEAIDLGTTPAPTPTPTPAPKPKPVVFDAPLDPKMHPGSRRPQVVDLKRYLVLAGYAHFSHAHLVDDFYGSGTQEAVALFYQRHGDQRSGAIGPKGWATLQKEAAAAKNKAAGL